MARNNSRNRGSRSSRNNGSALKTICSSIFGLSVIGGIGIAVSSCTGFHREIVDNHIASLKGVPALKAGQAVYLDFSNGMNSAYASGEAKSVLSRVLDKLITPQLKTQFFSLANGEITPLSEMSQTELYNKVMDAANYSQQQAPIEKALETIVNGGQAALLVTDYEEYKGSVIEQAAYAKQYFIDWLSKGYDITFYKWDYTEGGKAKHLYITVFDTQKGALASAVAEAIGQANASGVSKFVLPGAAYAYPMAESYLSDKQGGTYHDENGQDLVSATIENGDAESFVKYENAPHPTQYYPLGANWADIVTNSKAMQEPGVPNPFTYFLSNVYVNFTTQDAYDITGVGALTFDMADDPANANPTEVRDMFMTALKPYPKEFDGTKGWQEILLNFDPKFDGKSSSGSLLRVDVKIADAKIRTAQVQEFFGWEGNKSLESSVTNALEDAKVDPAKANPTILTYYLKTM